ncbi:hypothetical protein WKH57_14280 [Niallia taxi]|uniref:hypothetical protein n=1 Tax=Niallia taxi TaxID=2499688 RepID=UPI00317A531A
MIFKENLAPILLFGLGVLLGIQLYTFNTFQLNAFNIGAFFLTVSCVNQGSVTSKNNNIAIKSFRNINVTIGVLLLITAILASGFTYYDLLEKWINKVDTNALLLIGIAITLWSFKTSDTYTENLVEREKKKANENLSKYLRETEEKLKFKEENIRYKEENNDLKISNRELIKYLEEATKTVEILHEALEKRKKNE